MADPTITVTILDMPAILELLHEAIDAVPEWEQEQLRERLHALVERAEAAQRDSHARSRRLLD